MTAQGEKRFGLVEAGGTKIICAVGTAPDAIHDMTTFPTLLPAETLPNISDYFQQTASTGGALSTIGIGCFGPIDLDRGSSAYGTIAETTKCGWTNFNIVKHLSDALNVPVVIDTDVNCALLAEAHYGAGKGLKDLVYITVGTGIGAGLMVDGKIVRGYGHPEVGHMSVVKQDEDQAFSGVCRFHAAQCFEGVAAGPAITKRWEREARALAPEHPGLDLEARYLADLCLNLSLITAPRRIILGGGVMQQRHLFPLIRQHFDAQRRGYSNLGDGLDMDTYIVPAALAPQAGIIGALCLASGARCP